MITKLIKVYVKPGYMPEYLKCQEIWNRETMKTSGCLGFYCGQVSEEENIVHLLFFWKSLEEYETWMIVEHDRIASEAAASDYYDKMEVKILQPLL